MPGRRIPSESELLTSASVYGGNYFVRRRAILSETLNAFNNVDPPDRYHRVAMVNLQRWQNEAESPAAELAVLILPGDWGEVTHSLTKRYGTCFAVLNMANAYVPGGAYVEGAVAQEENMFRRTDCHFRVGDEEYDAVQDRYLPEMTELLSAKDGVVYLDTERPRVCIRGGENKSLDDLGYSWLAEEEVFPFFELRAAAQDLRDGSSFNSKEMQRRIAAQFESLRLEGLRHTVLSAFGCGAFQNPADQVAQLYKEQIDKCRADFDVIAFAIFSPGYGPDNYSPFKAVFGG